MQIKTFKYVARLSSSKRARFSSSQTTTCRTLTPTTVDGIFITGSNCTGNRIESLSDYCDRMMPVTLQKKGEDPAAGESHSMTLISSALAMCWILYGPVTFKA